MTGNTPGIPKRSIPSLKPSTTKASSVSSSAKSAATSGLNGAKKTQVFHRNLGQNGSVFGGGWQPAARGFNPHDPVSANVNRYAALRQQANMYNTGGMYNFGQVTGHNHSGTDKMAEVMAWTQLGMQALNMAGEMTTDIIELAQANKAAAPGATVAKAAIPTANTVSSANASLVSDMTEAKDAASLESAIKHAQAKADEIDQSLGGLKTAAEEATTRKADLESQKAATETELNTKKVAVAKARDSVSISRTVLQATDTKLGEARANLAIAQGNTAAAQANVERIRVLVDSETNDVAKATLQVQLEQAQATLATAQQEEANAKAALDNANTEHDQATVEVKRQEKQLSTAQKELKTAEQERDAVQKELDKLNEQINTQQDAIDKYETAKKDRDGLEAQITQQQARLETLRKEEKAKLEGLLAENDKLDDGIEGEVDTNKEKNLSKKIKKNDAEIAQMMKDAEEGILKGPAENIAGTEFRTGKGPDGSTIYMVGKNAVTQNEYETKRTAAQALQSGVNKLATEGVQQALQMEDSPFESAKYEHLGETGFKHGVFKDNKGDVYLINGKPVDKATYETTKSAASKAQRARVTLGSPTIINNTKFEVTKDGKFKVGGREVAEDVFNTQIRNAQTAEEKAEKEATMKKDLVDAQLNPEGKEVKGQMVNIIVNTEQGTIEYKIGVKTYDSKAEFEDAFKKLYQT